tara:strand:+ start:1641 stop:2504 length:864 start_codon:yes stop_codon:yes gene_type:complete
MKTNSQINYKVVDNFLSFEECDSLIEDSNKILKNENSSVIHGGRTFVSCVDNEFRNLRDKSRVWKKLTDKISSNEFFNNCCNDLNINADNFKNIKYFNKLNVPSYETKYRSINKLTLQTLNLNQLIKYLFLRMFKKLKKIIFIDLFTLSKQPIEMLYDYSSAVNGYGREIHRDSDNRMIVCLLYLSSLSKESSGGNLKLYKHKDIEKTRFIAQPKEEDCEIIDTIKPEKGRLVIFENTEKSYHSVDKIENNTSPRHFVCGNFTILKGRNPQMKNSINRLKTPFHMYY